MLTGRGEGCCSANAVWRRWLCGASYSSLLVHLSYPSLGHEASCPSVEFQGRAVCCGRIGLVEELLERVPLIGRRLIRRLAVVCEYDSGPQRRGQVENTLACNAVDRLTDRGPVPKSVRRGSWVGGMCGAVHGRSGSVDYQVKLLGLLTRHVMHSSSCSCYTYLGRYVIRSSVGQVPTYLGNSGRCAPPSQPRQKPATSGRNRGPCAAFRSAGLPWPS